MPPSAANSSRSTHTTSDEWYEADPTAGNTIEIHEDDLNPDHQGFIGFIPPKDGPMHPIEKTAKRIAAELVLLPRKSRPKSGYDEEYLKKTSGCRNWHRLKCAHCDCWKAD